MPDTKQPLFPMLFVRHTLLLLSPVCIQWMKTYNLLCLYSGCAYTFSTMLGVLIRLYLSAILFYSYGQAWTCWSIYRPSRRLGLREASCPSSSAQSDMVLFYPILGHPYPLFFYFSFTSLHLDIARFGGHGQTWLCHWSFGWKKQGSRND